MSAPSPTPDVPGWGANAILPEGNVAYASSTSAGTANAADVEVVSWYVMMGIGQVVTLHVASERLRDINRLVEGEAWGGFRTEFYPTYDYRTLYAALRDKMR